MRTNLVGGRVVGLGCQGVRVSVRARARGWCLEDDRVGVLDEALLDHSGGVVRREHHLQGVITR